MRFIRRRATGGFARIASGFRYKLLWIWVMLLASTACSSRSQDDVEKLILEYPNLRRANELCTMVQRPPDFKFVGKDVFSNSERDLIGFYYRSDLPGKSVANFFENSLGSEGWIVTAPWDEDPTRRSGNIGFLKEKYTISVGVSGDSNYSIACGVSRK